jgi:RHS repeat-associated protein
MSASAGTVYYLHGQNNDLGYEKEVKDNGLIEHKHYLSAGGIVFAMQVTRTGNTATGGVNGSAKPTQSLPYMHHDHLGSVSVLTDDSGSVIERLAYDPWGKRRFPNGTADINDSIVGLTLDRGFTMHEHLDEMGVIHMNGRIYDPLIGRFMSADPFIPDASNLQAHNRFAYVYNNPLKYTDPDGFKPFWKKKWFKAVVAIAVGYFTGQWIGNLLQSGAGLTGSAFYSVGTASALGPIAPGLTALGSAVAGAAGGFAAGLVGSGGDLKAGLLGALSGGMFGFVGGTYSAGSFGNYAGHAATGCITSVAGGGKCGSGAASALFGKFATNMTDGIQSDLGRGVASVVAGGVGSVIAGGKFENGAVTAAYGYLFNFGLQVLRGVFSSSPMNPNGDIGHRVVNGARDGLIQTGEAVSNAVAVCGVVNPACRSADAVLSWTKIGVDVTSNGNGSAVPGQIAGDGVYGVVAAALKVVNSVAAQINRLPAAFIEGSAYVSGKAVEFHVTEKNKKGF